MLITGKKSGMQYLKSMNEKRIRILVDTDVVLDFLTGREPFAEQAARIFTLSEHGTITACVSALTIANCYYILRWYASHRLVIEKLMQFSGLVEILDIRKECIMNAFLSGFSDFEDAIQHEVARSEPPLTTIVTRNIRDFRKSTVPAMMPGEFLRSIGIAE